VGAAAITWLGAACGGAALEYEPEVGGGGGLPEVGGSGGSAGDDAPGGAGGEAATAGSGG
jgi:hypothetical protein